MKDIFSKNGIEVCKGGLDGEDNTAGYWIGGRVNKWYLSSKDALELANAILKEEKESEDE